MSTEIKAKTTIDAAEVEQFSRIADEWWDPHGKFKPLHDINPLRIGWIKDRIQDSGFRIQDTRLLDIGCGGGLICEPMARLGATVTGIDASQKNIKVASLHAEKSGLSIYYRCTTAEDLVSSLRGGAADAAIQKPSLTVWIAAST
jgi:2-polyprenyl-6-hydroxyphenyl methylase / 3-demethylubiquinone-9 3-methyltransferase